MTQRTRRSDRYVINCPISANFDIKINSKHKASHCLRQLNIKLAHNSLDGMSSGVTSTTRPATIVDDNARHAAWLSHTRAPLQFHLFNVVTKVFPFQTVGRCCLPFRAMIMNTSRVQTSRRRLIALAIKFTLNRDRFRFPKNTFQKTKTNAWSLPFFLYREPPAAEVWMWFIRLAACP